MKLAQSLVNINNNNYYYSLSISVVRS